MRILITGATGFVGRNLFESYRNKYHCYAPTHAQLDLLDYHATENYISRHKIDTVIHAAVKGDENVLDSTLRMYINILGNLKQLKKFIHFGSGAEYDKSRDLIKIKETAWGERIPLDPYGLAKYTCSLISGCHPEHVSGSHNSKITTLRLFGVYGKYEDYRFKFISNTIAKVLLRLPIVIKQDVIFDYLYIDDLVRIVEEFLKRTPPYPDYNITPDKSIRLTDITEIIIKINQRHSGKSRRERDASRISGGSRTSQDDYYKILNKNLNFRYTAANDRLKSFIPSLKFTPYEKGISELYHFYKINPGLIDDNDLKEDKYLASARIRK